MRICKGKQVSIGSPSGDFAPRRQVCSALVIGNECVGPAQGRKHSVERGAGLFDRNGSGGPLDGNPDKSQLRDGRGQELSASEGQFELQARSSIESRQRLADAEKRILSLQSMIGRLRNSKSSRAAGKSTGGNQRDGRDSTNGNSNNRSTGKAAGTAFEFVDLRGKPVLQTIARNFVELRALQSFARPLRPCLICYFTPTRPSRDRRPRSWSRFCPRLALPATAVRQAPAR